MRGRAGMAELADKVALIDVTLIDCAATLHIYFVGIAGFAACIRDVTALPQSDARGHNFSVGTYPSAVRKSRWSRCGIQ